MLDIWFYSIFSVLIISLVSLIGIITLPINAKRFEQIIVYMISFSAGALLGDAFIHLLPEAIKENGFTVQISLFLISGIIFSFIIEKILHWRHCHHPTTKEHPHNLSTMNLFGEGVHNFIDGIIIGASYIVSIPVGIAATTAILFHEIPQEIGDYSVLVYGGFSRRKALLMNFLISLTAVLGVIISLIMGIYTDNFLLFLIPFAAGNFIYIACSDLIPEIHKNSDKISKSLMQLILFILGIAIMYFFRIFGS
ncbi:MAG: ZIP family metal transporter [Candidatus Pacearchaeota archaeon]|jgi:zinc and cadmium transporter